MNSGGPQISGIFTRLHPVDPLTTKLSSVKRKKGATRKRKKTLLFQF